MIILTLKEIFNAVPFLREISNKEFPSSTAFKIARLIRELDKEIELFEIERTKIIYKNCEKDNNGNPVLLEGGNIKEEAYTGDGKAVIVAINKGSSAANQKFVVNNGNIKSI